MVYDADGGLAGELRYVVGHLLGRAECSLCDITHGTVKRKAAFDELVGAVEADGHGVEVHHRNEQTPSQAAAAPVTSRACWSACTRLMARGGSS